MRKFLKYEFKNNWKDFLLSYILILFSFIVLSLFILIVKDQTDFSSFMVKLYSSLILLVIISIFTSLILFIINIVRSFYTQIFTDEGYLTLSIPKSSHCLLLSKIISNLVWFIIYSITICIGLLLVFVTLNSAVNSLFEDIMYMVNEVKDIFPAIPFAIIGSFISLIFNFTILLLSFVLLNIGKIKKGKIFAGIIIYLVINYVVYIGFDFLDGISFGIAITNEAKLAFMTGSPHSDAFFDMGGIYYACNFTTVILEILFSVGTYFLTKYLLDNYLELE